MWGLARLYAHSGRSSFSSRLFGLDRCGVNANNLLLIPLIKTKNVANNLIKTPLVRAKSDSVTAISVKEESSIITFPSPDNLA